MTSRQSKVFKAGSYLDNRNGNRATWAPRARQEKVREQSEGKGSFKVREKGMGEMPGELKAGLGDM